MENDNNLKNDKIEAFADRLGVTPSTVSKAVNHCKGVSASMRDQILSEAARYGIRGKRSPAGGAYVILPESPGYFWDVMLSSLSEALSARGITPKNNIYSRTGDNTTVARYLDEAEDIGSRVIILAAAMCDATLLARISRLAESKAVFFVCTPTDAANTFYFGSNYYEDGRLLGERVRGEHPSLRRLVILGDDTGRYPGFCSAFAGSEVELRTVPYDARNQSMELSRTLHGLRETFPFEAAVCLDGATKTVCMAMKKCRLSVPLYGFEHPPIEARYGRMAGEVCQDLPGIARATADAAAEYLFSSCLPPSKYTYVPSGYRHA